MRNYILFKLQKITIENDIYRIYTAIFELFITIQKRDKETHISSFNVQ